MAIDPASPIRNLLDLPADLPVPIDDGACDHLVDREVPATRLPGTSGHDHDLSAESQERWIVVYAYPRTGRPDQPALGGQEEWDATPGARGCTPQSIGYSTAATEFGELDATVYGLSTQDTHYQREATNRLGLQQELLSDHRLELTNALGLPTMTIAGTTLLRRFTLFLRAGHIRHVRYPVFPPNTDAEYTVRWLRRAQ
jgi:peroxiredoxin